MPSVTEYIQLFVIKLGRGEIELCQAGFQILPIDGVQRGEAALTFTDRVNSTVIVSDPCVGKSSCVNMAYVVTLQECFNFIRNAASPIDNRTQNVKEQYVNILHLVVSIFLR